MTMTQTETKTPPKPILPKGIIIEDLGGFLNYHSRAFMDIDPMEMARQLTLIDFVSYRGIRAKECLDQAWEKSDKMTRSPNVSRMIRNMNNVNQNEVKRSFYPCFILFY
jgi:hypothetical protein